MTDFGIDGINPPAYFEADELAGKTDVQVIKSLELKMKGEDGYSLFGPALHIIGDVSPKSIAANFALYIQNKKDRKHTMVVKKFMQSDARVYSSASIYVHPSNKKLFSISSADYTIEITQSGISLSRAVMKNSVDLVIMQSSSCEYPNILEEYYQHLLAETE